MPLTTISSLRVVNDPAEADRLIDVALNQVEAIAEDHFAGRNFTIRDLNQIHFAFLDHKDNYYSLE